MWSRGWAASSIAFSASARDVEGGRVNTSTRRPSAWLAVSSPAGRSPNQLSSTSLLSSGPSTRSRRGWASQSAARSPLCTMGRWSSDGPCACSARTSPGSSAAGSAERGHQTPSGNVRPEPSPVGPSSVGPARTAGAGGRIASRGVRDGEKLMVVLRPDMFRTGLRPFPQRRGQPPPGALPAGRGRLDASLLPIDAAEVIPQGDRRLDPSHIDNSQLFTRYLHNTHYLLNFRAECGKP